MLDHRIASEARPLDLLCRRLDVARAQGDMCRCAALAAEIIDRDSEHPAAHAYRRAANGVGIGLTSSAPGLAPFRIVEEALEAVVAVRLLSEIEETLASFSPAGISEARDSVDLTSAGRRALSRPIRGAARGHILDAVAPHLAACVGIPMEHLRPDNVELKFSISRPGDFFHPHRDSQIGGRSISFSLYLHAAPRTFRGGDLVLFDTETSGEHEPTLRGFTRIECRHNRLVLFSSSSMHEVLRVRSIEGVEAGLRCAVTGHLAAAPA